MATFVICKNCEKKIKTARPAGNVRVEGDVKYGGVQFDGSSINFGNDGGINFGQGGAVVFTNPSDVSITCPYCHSTHQYSAQDFVDEWFEYGKIMSFQNI